jgi:hypothetical protein
MKKDLSITVSSADLQSAILSAVGPTAATILAPLVSNALPVLENWATSTAPGSLVSQLDAWIALVQTNQTAARAQLLAGMSDAALLAQDQADAAQSTTDTAANAAQITAWESALDSGVMGAIVVVANLISSAFGAGAVVSL